MPQNYNLFLKGDVGGWNFTSDMVNYVLDRNKNTEVKVLVNSLGGNTYTALSISSLFKLHGQVHVHFVGFNASAATIAAMGAKRITIDADAGFLVHKCMGVVVDMDWLNADELATRIKELEKQKANQDAIDSCVAGMYAKRCNKTKEELLELMSKDTWLSASEALEWGFVDEITDKAEDKTPALSSSAVASLVSAGIPVPPMAKSPKKNSMMERFFAFLQSFTNPEPEAKPQEPEKQSSIMAKFTSIAALLGVSLSMSDDKLFLSEEQATSINTTLEENKATIDSLNASVADKDKEIAELKASIAEKDAVIADLKKDPAEPTSTVNDDSKSDVDPYAPVSEADALAASKAFIEAFI